MPKDMPIDVRIEAVAGKPVELPSGDFIANASMTRVGADLHLTAPDGHTIIVEGYFAQQSPPDLTTHDGARLTSAMVDAFVPPEHASQYAASGQIANDSSPAGRITQQVGDAFVVHADGTKVPAAVGTPVYQGDVIETSKTGAVSIQFADNTTFAISENARMSVDQFVYHSADHSGSTFFSMLQGMFVYTSGLIGKTNPADVSIETPVGSIGIRGTVVAGHIMPAGQQSQITIVDGAVTVTNGAGTQDLNTSLATVSVTGYQSQPEPVHMDANTFNNSYHSISSVAGESLSHFTGMPAPSATHSGEHGSEGTVPAPAGEAAPAATAPPAAHTTPAESAPAPTGSNTTTAPATTEASATTTATTTTPTADQTTTTIIVAPTASTTTTSSFSSSSSTSSFGTTGTTSFTAPTTTSAGGFGTGTTSTNSTTSTTTTTTSTTTTTAPPPVVFSLHATDTTNGSTTAVGVPITYTLTFNEPLSAATVTNMISSPSSFFSNHGTSTIVIQGLVATGTPNQYTLTILPTTVGTLQMGATGITAANGDSLTNSIQSTIETVTHDMAIQWGAAYLKGTTTTADDGISSLLQNGSVIGHVATAPGATVGSYTITVAGGGQEYNISGNPQSIASPGSVFSINASGDIVVNNYLALSSILNPTGLNIDIKAYSGTSGSGTLLDTLSGVVKIDNYPTNAASGMAPTIFTGPGNPTGNTSTPNYMVTNYGTATITGGTADDILVAAGGTNGAAGDTIIGNGGADILIGGAGNDVLKVSDSTFIAVDGGGGVNRLELDGNNTSVDFTTANKTVRHISEIDFGSASSGDSSIKLNAQNIFDMTHTVAGSGTTADVLNVKSSGSGQHNLLNVGGLTLDAGDKWGVSQVLHYTGHAADGTLVKLAVQEFMNAGDSFSSAGSILVSDSSHLFASPTYSTNTSLSASADNQVLVGTAPSFGQMLNDGGHTGDILVGNSSGYGNTITITNANFSLIDGGAESTAGNELDLYSSTGNFSLDFSSISGTVRNIDAIDLGGGGGNGNSVTLDIKDVFNMTNAADNYTLHISNSIAANTNSLASVTVVSDANGIFSQTAGTTLASLTSAVTPSQISFSGAYQGHTVTLVIDGATSVSTAQGAVTNTSVHVATATH